jgi:hypothetical protein
MDVKNRVSGSALREDNLFLSILLECSVSHDGEEHFGIEGRASAFLSHRQAPFEEVRQATEDPQIAGLLMFSSAGAALSTAR